MILLFQERDDDNVSSEWQVLGKMPGNEPRDILELARVFSIEQGSDLVLCAHFLPWMDLAVSASEDGWHPPQSSAADLDRRCREVMALVEQSQETLLGRSEWCRAALSFGLVRWWPVALRAQALSALGPCPVVIDCTQNPGPLIRLPFGLA